MLKKEEFMEIIGKQTEHQKQFLVKERDRGTEWWGRDKKKKKEKQAANTTGKD